MCRQKVKDQGGKRRRSGYSGEAFQRRDLDFWQQDDGQIYFRLVYILFSTIDVSVQLKSSLDSAYKCNFQGAKNVGGTLIMDTLPTLHLHRCTSKDVPPLLKTFGLIQHLIFRSVKK